MLYEVITVPLPQGLLDMHDQPSWGPDPVRQSTPSPSAPIPITAWDGYGSDDNAALFGTRYAPPDSEGDIGVDYYVSRITSYNVCYTKLLRTLRLPERREPKRKFSPTRTPWA